MTKEKSPARQGPRYIFYFLMLAILGWFIFMQFFGADERTVSGNSPSLLYPGTFTWEKSDGTTEEITVPGSYDVPAGETMVITSTLSADFDASSIAIRSSLQDVNIYINGTLREQYSTSKTRLIGKNSASRFIFCSTSHEDAGKELRIELTTYTSNYSGVVNQIFCGDKADIWQLIFNGVLSRYGTALALNEWYGFWGLIILVSWQQIGYMMIIYIAGLQSIPGDIIEAAEIDGANKIQTLFKVTIPMMMPSITICMFLSITNGFKLFDQNLSLTAGEPSKMSEMMALNIFNTFYGRTGWEGVGQAKAVIFFAIVVVIGMIQLRATRSKEVQQ